MNSLIILIKKTTTFLNLTYLSCMLTIAINVAPLQSASAAEYQFKLHHFLGATSLWQTQILEPWATQVAQNSDGRISIEIFPSMTLGGRPAELVQQARDGVVDIIWTVNGYTPGIFPRSEVFELPTIFTNDPVPVNLALYDLFESDLKEDYAGLEVLFLSVHAGNAIHMANQEVHSPSDLKGKKIRTPSRTGAWSIEALGAIPVAMPVPDLPQSLQKGVVDGAFVPMEIIPLLQLQHQTKYQIEGYNNERIGALTFQTSMNKARWESLPTDIQQAFKLASGPEWWAEIGRRLKIGEIEGLKSATDVGNVHIILDKDETRVFNTILSTVVDRWIKDVNSKNIDGENLVNKARAAIASHITDS